VIRTTREVMGDPETSAGNSALDAFTRSRYRGVRNCEEEAYADTVTVNRTPEPDPAGSDDPGAKAAKGPATLITDARIGTSEEMSSRVRQYTLTMAFRTACFIAMVFVDGPLRWVLFACAVALPLVAVMAANQAKRRGKAGKVAQPEPPSRPQLTTGHEPDVIDEMAGGKQESPGQRVA
jgi:Protein of unknown function (DUF3099)